MCPRVERMGEVKAATLLTHSKQRVEKQARDFSRRLSPWRRAWTEAECSSTVDVRMGTPLRSKGSQISRHEEA